MLVGKVEMGVEMLESLRAKLRIPGKGTRKGMEDLLLKLEDLLGEPLTCRHLYADPFFSERNLPSLRSIPFYPWQPRDRRLSRTWTQLMRSVWCS